MRLVFTWKELIVFNGITEIARYPASCEVRTELNGRRSKNEVVYTYPESGRHAPYYPRQFPSGIFKITGIEYTDDPDYSPVKIKTDATRKVFIWDLNVKGEYWEPVEKIQVDTCYWLHYTDSRTTLGCIKINNKQDIIHLANIIDPVLNHKDIVYLEVL